MSLKKKTFDHNASARGKKVFLFPSFKFFPNHFYNAVENLHFRSTRIIWFIKCFTTTFLSKGSKTISHVYASCKTYG